MKAVVRKYLPSFVLRRVAQGALGALFLFTSAGIPMVTYFCGGEGSTAVCPMGACEQEQHEGLAISSPDCCTPVVQQSDIDNGLLAHNVDVTVVHSHLTTNINPSLHDLRSEYADYSIQVHSPPLRILVHSFLI